jgi:Curlin associated repeat
VFTVANYNIQIALLVAVVFACHSSHAHSQSASANDNPPGNDAIVHQLGQDQRAVIEQNNIAGGLLSGAIQQQGVGNSASMSLEGGNLTGSILQDGNDNSATLEVRDRDNRGAIEQYGNANSGGLRVEGDGKDVTLIQQGGVQNHGAIKIGGDTPGGLPIIIRQY